ncbi:AAA family ATPase [Streptomyces sp. NPDC002547]
MVRSLVVGAGDFPEVFVDEETSARGMEPFEPLPSVAGAVEDVARALCGAGIEVEAPLLDPDRDELLAAWHTALDQAAGRPLVVHFSGHGEHQRALYLAVRGSERGRRLRATSVEVNELLEDAEAGDSPVLFLLDVCEAGHAVTGQLVKDLVLAATGERQPSAARNAWVIGACSAGETTRQARFSRATAAVLRLLADGWLDVSPALEHVPIETFAAEVARQLAHDNGLGQSVVRTPTELALEEVPGFFPNPAYARDAQGRFLAGVEAELRQLALATDPALDLLHFATRAAGNQQADVCQFSGRVSHLERIQTWLDDMAGDQERLLIVTGSPGTGKSALLGVTTCLLHPALKPLRRRVRVRVTGFNPRPEAQILAVHARQLTLQQIIDSLMRQLSAFAHRAEPAPADRGAGDKPGSPGPGAAEEFEELAARIRATGPVTVILDALDEAADPSAIVHDLILPLISTGTDGRAHVPGCRVMVGTRPWWETLHQLHEHVAARPGALLALDPATADDRQVLADDLTSYLGLLLDNTYPDTTPRLIAHRLAHHAETGAFLIAALYADHLLQQAAAGDPLSVDQVSADLPCTITEVFDLHTRTLAATDPWVLPVLQTLGQARGHGMPLELLHKAALAHTCQNDASLQPSLEHTRKVLLKTAFYLRTTPDSDQRLLYRYFHQALTDHTAHTTNPTTIYHAIIGTIPTTAGTPDWGLAHPYLRHHAAAHAAAAGHGALDRLLEDPLFLLQADPDTLAPHLHHAASPQARHHADIYRTTTIHHPQRHNPLARRNLLAVDAIARQNPNLAQNLAESALEHAAAPAIPQWATGHATDPARLNTLIGPPTSSVRAVATAVLPDRHTIAVTGNSDGLVAVWDLETGEQIHTLTGHTKWVQAAATAVLPDGRSIAVTGDSHGLVAVWDLETGEQIHTLTRNTSSVRAVAAAALPDGRTIAVDGRETGSVFVWDLRTGEQIRTFTGHIEPVRSAATAVTPDGRSISVIGYSHGLVAVWDLHTGEQIHTLTGHTGGVQAAATAVLPDGRSIAVTGDGYGLVAVWDLETGEQIHTLTGHKSSVYGLETATLPDGRTIAVDGRGTGSVLVWDLETGEQIRTLSGHIEPVRSVATAALPDGRSIVLSGEDRGLVFVWDLETGMQTRPFPGHTGTVSAAATAVLPSGCTVAVTSGHDGLVFVRSLETGEQIQALIGRHLMTDVATATLSDGRSVAVTGDSNGLVAVWDLKTGEQIHTLPGHTWWVVVATAALADGRTVAITGNTDGPQLFVWDLETGEQIHTLPGHTEGTHAVATAALADGRTVAVTGNTDGSVYVWDLETGEQIHTLPGHTRWVEAVATAALPDRRTVAVTGGFDGSVYVWDLETGEQIHTLPGHTGWVQAVATSILPDGRIVALTGSSNGSLYVWDLESGEPTYPALHLPARVGAVASTGEGIILGYGYDAAYLTWNIPNDPGESAR